MAANREGKAPKSIHNYPGLLHSILPSRSGAVSARRIRTQPPAPGSDPDIRYLDDPSSQRCSRPSLLCWGELERAPHWTAATTGLRQSELTACAGSAGLGAPCRSHRVSSSCWWRKVSISLDADLVQRPRSLPSPLGVSLRPPPSSRSMPGQASAGADASGYRSGTLTTSTTGIPSGDWQGHRGA